MPSVVRAAEPQTPHPTASKKKFRTVLGLRAVFKESAAPINTHPSTVGRNSHFLTRKSIDTARSYRQRRKHRANRSSVTDVSFFEHDAVEIAPNDDNEPEPPIAFENMKNLDASRGRPSRRPPVRMDAQDGPWSVSVAETPHDACSYSLYIKSESVVLYVSPVPRRVSQSRRSFGHAA